MYKVKMYTNNINQVFCKNALNMEQTTNNHLARQLDDNDNNNKKPNNSLLPML